MRKFSTFLLFLMLCASAFAQGKTEAKHIDFPSDIHNDFGHSSTSNRSEQPFYLQQPRLGLHMAAIKGMELKYNIGIGASVELNGFLFDVSFIDKASIGGQYLGFVNYVFHAGYCIPVVDHFILEPLIGKYTYSDNNKTFSYKSLDYGIRMEYNLGSFLITTTATTLTCSIGIGFYINS